MLLRGSKSVECDTNSRLLKAHQLNHYALKIVVRPLPLWKCRASDLNLGSLEFVLL
jgi:hypothetical protein